MDEISIGDKNNVWLQSEECRRLFLLWEKPCTKTPDTLKMIARTLLAAGVIESGADQVTVNGIDYADTQHMYMRKYEAGKRSSRRRGPNQEQVKTLEKILARVSGRKWHE